MTVSLALSTVQATGGAGSDTLTGVENLAGSAYADTLTGNAGTNGTGNSLSNTITGNAGVNRIDGGSGGGSMTSLLSISSCLPPCTT